MARENWVIGCMSLGRAFEHLGEIAGQGAALPPFLGDGRDVLGRRDLARQEKIEDAFRERLVSARGLGQLGLEVGDGESAEADPFVGSRAEISQTMHLTERIPP